MVAGAIALAGCTQSPAVPSAVSDKPKTTQPEVVDERPYEGCENPEDLANWDDLKNDPTYTHVVPPECEDYVNSSRNGVLNYLVIRDLNNYKVFFS